MTIILYDIPSTLPNTRWNPNVWKTRFSLNFKGLPFKTEWVEYPDIEPTCKKLGIPPTSKKPDGSPFYTLPAIHDPSTGTFISESMLIAEYLEKTYPDTPKLFPNGTAGVLSAFADGFMTNLGPISSLILPDALQHLHPASQAYVAPRIIPIANKNRAEDWGKFKDAMQQIDQWYARNGGKGLFLLGEIPSWADVVLASFLIFMKTIWGEDSAEWKDIISWNDGRWKNHAETFKKYENAA